MVLGKKNQLGDWGRGGEGSKPKEAWRAGALLEAEPLPEEGRQPARPRLGCRTEGAGAGSGRDCPAESQGEKQ